MKITECVSHRTERPSDDIGRRRARIVYFDHTSSWSGGEIALFNLIQEIDRSRFEPVVILCREGPLLSRLKEIDVETHLLPLAEAVLDTPKDSLGLATVFRFGKIVDTILYTLKLAWLLSIQKAQILHTNSLKADIIGGVAARIIGVPVVWHVRDRIAAEYLPQRAVTAFRWASRFIPNFIIFNSFSTLSALDSSVEKDCKMNTNECESNSIDLTDFRTVKVVHDGVGANMGPNMYLSRQKMLNPRDGVKIGLIGRISPWKGQDIFIQAATIVRDQFPKTKFIIIGSALFNETDFEQSLHKLRSDLQLEECVEFWGFRSDMREVISELDMIVHASTIGEPFGQVIVEGMAAGKPVIATNGGGVPEIIEHGIHGILIPMKDADAMAKAICLLLGDPQMACNLANNGRQHVENCFLIEQTARKVEVVYDRILRT